MWFNKTLCPNLYVLYALYGSKKLYVLLYALYAFVVQKKLYVLLLCPLMPYVVQ